MTQAPSNRPRYGQPNREYGMRLATTPPEQDGPIYMLNLMKYRAVADYADPAAGTRTGREADDLYSPTDVLSDIGAHIVFVANVERQLNGGEPNWERVAMVRYPTRRSFIDMQRRDDFHEKHVHKEAGMEQTIVMGCVPGAPPHSVPGAPPTPGRAVLLQVVRFEDDQARQSFVSSAVPGRQLFSVEGTILGDGRLWDVATFQEFASVDEAGAQAPAAGAADAYALVLVPGIDRIAKSLAVPDAPGPQ